MPRFIWDGDEWVDIALLPPRPRSKAPAIISDHHDPFVSQADGRTYDSKSAYRRSLRERGMVEVGNDIPEHREFESTFSADEVKRAIADVNSGRGAKDVSEARLKESISKGKTVV